MSYLFPGNYTLGKLMKNVPDDLVCSLCILPTADWRQACVNGQHSFCKFCLEMHVERCVDEETLPFCPGCRDVITFQTHADHEYVLRVDRLRNSMTMEYTVTCPKNCGKTMNLAQYNQHVEKECPEHVISCMFKSAGCKFMCARKDMKDHEAKPHNEFVTGMFMSFGEKVREDNAVLKTATLSLTHHIRALVEDVGNLKRVVDKQKETIETLTDKLSGMERNLSLK